MANLIIDIGNTAVKASWSEGMTLGKTFRYQGEKVRSFIISLTEKEKPEIMVISSVYEISGPDEAAFRKECDKLLLLDSAHTDILKENMLPEYLTYDRAASIMAARYLFRGKGCTVVDFGTTLTIDFTDEEGRYSGGNVSLGCRTRFKALNRYSRALPLIDSPEEVPVTGDTFTTSVASGVISGIMFEIDGYIGLHPDNIVVFTGGDANYFAKRMKNSIFVVSNLVLMGLAIIADRYVKKD
ncbi:MAG: type III pantothenate kinase [Bacteroidales bacterium]|nr:type III pantothenate kinase [Bacteroidales bacterium]MCR5244022.1 type III pantothenate kinase [Bacteroidales bacterium]MDT3356104.1 type III pantothenate kinase [Bacteroidota bacterium]